MTRWLRGVLVRLANRIADAERPAPLLVPAGVTATIILGPMATDRDRGIIIRGKFADVELDGHLTVVFQDKDGQPS